MHINGLKKPLLTYFTLNFGGIIDPFTAFSLPHKGKRPRNRIEPNNARCHFSGSGVFVLKIICTSKMSPIV